MRERDVTHLATATGLGSARHHISAPEKLMGPVVWELPAIIALTVVLLSVPDSDTTTQETMNYFAPFWLSGALGYTALKMILLDSHTIWTPLFWFRIATITYFGFGSIVPFFVNAATRMYLESYFILFASDMWKVNLLVAASVAVVLGANVTIESLRGHRVHEPSRGLGKDQIAEALKSGLLFLAIGGGVKYLVILPDELAGWPVVIPGFIVNLTAFLNVAISLLTIWSLHQKTSYILIVVFLVALAMLVGLLELSKLETLFPFVAFVIGVLTVKASVARLAAVAIALSVMFNFLQPLIADARLKNVEVYGSMNNQSPISARVQFLLSAFDNSFEQNGSEEIQQGAVRLSFINSAGFVISMYDRGFYGDSLKNVLYVFIPRLLWPDKPEVVVSGELASRASGTVGNAISAGYFADAYWNFGWAGLLLLLPLGVAFNITTRFAINTLRQGEWIYAPVLFLNLRIAIEVDNFVIGVIGSFAISLAVYLLLRWIRFQQIGIWPFSARRH